MTTAKWQHACAAAIFVLGLVAGFLPKFTFIQPTWAVLIGALCAVLITVLTFVSNNIQSVLNDAPGSPAWVAHMLGILNGILAISQTAIAMPSFGVGQTTIDAVVPVLSFIEALLSYAANQLLPAGSSAVMAHIAKQRSA